MKKVLFVKQWKEKERLKKFLGTIIENFKLPKSKTVTNTELKNIIKEEVEKAVAKKA